MIVKLKNRYANTPARNTYRHNHILGIGETPPPECYDSPMLMVQGQLICTEQLHDKMLFAAKTVKVYNHPYSGNQVLYSVQKNKPIGKVYSQISSGGNVWLMLDPGPPMAAVWVKAENGAFNLEALQDQGAQTQQDIEDANQSWWENVTEGAGNLIQDTVSPTKNLVKFGVPLLIGYIVYKDFIAPRQNRR